MFESHLCILSLTTCAILCEHFTVNLLCGVTVRSGVCRVAFSAVSLCLKKMYYLVKTVVTLNVTGKIPEGIGEYQRAKWWLLQCH